MPKIAYPYNEILPTKRAHDVFIYNECAYLANSGCEVTLLCGNGSHDLSSHYQAPRSLNLHIKQLPICRRNNWLGLNSNLPFFFFTQKALKKIQPDIVILSVFKQGKYHLKRKIPGTKYIYEVHQLAYYPNSPYDPNKLQEEKEMLSRADLVVTTTDQLTQILQNPPYNFTHVKTLSLAVSVTSLPPPSPQAPFTMAYVGQLYKEQGISNLLQALAQTSYHLKIVGGKPEEIVYYQKECERLNISSRVTFLGFQAPTSLSSVLTDVHAFVAPFEARGKMCYVAHTKLLEYIDWQRLVIAPDLDVVKECFLNNKAVQYFTPENPSSLASAMQIACKNYSKFSQDFFSEKRFTWEQRIINYNNLFYKLLYNKH